MVDRLLVCGSRDWPDVEIVEMVIEGFRRYSSDDLVVIEGCARGADWAAHNYELVEHEHYPADWDKFGKAAGPIRNQQMLAEGRPEMVVAFTDQPPTKGTADMVRRAKRAGLPVYVVSRA